MTMQRRRTGEAGEKAAREYLEKQGYRIEQLNYRCEFGEMDIVARDGASLIFVEVRTRTGYAFGTPVESINARKQSRLKNLAQHYLKHRYGRELPCRFDLIAILMERGTLEVTELKHYSGLEFG